MSAGRSAEAHARALRAGARRGLWRRVAAWLGWSATVRRADAQAALWAHGAAGETATAKLLDPLRREGWTVWHDMAVPGRRFNLDHVLAAPTGTGLLVVDSKAWRRTWPTGLVNGRLHCGPQDRHAQLQKVADYTEAVAGAVGLPLANVLPLLVVHGSPIAGGFVWVPVTGAHQRVLVISPDRLLGLLRDSVEGLPDRVAARALAAHVGSVLRPYVQAG